MSQFCPFLHCLFYVPWTMTAIYIQSQWETGPCLSIHKGHSQEGITVPAAPLPTTGEDGVLCPSPDTLGQALDPALRRQGTSGQLQEDPQHGGGDPKRTKLNSPT